MAKITDQHIDSGAGMFRFVVEDEHGTISQHAVSLDGDVDIQAHMDAMLTERDARTAKIDALAQKLNVRIKTRTEQ